jgi:hypothetical protein
MLSGSVTSLISTAVTCAPAAPVANWARSLPLFCMKAPPCVHFPRRCCEQDIPGEATEQTWGINVITADMHYFAELSDNEELDSVPYDNQVIEASNDEEAIGKASEWAASRKLAVVAMLNVKQGIRDVLNRKVYLGA